MSNAGRAVRPKPAWWRFLLALLAFLIFSQAPVGAAFAPVDGGALLVAAGIFGTAIAAWSIAGKPSVGALVLALGVALVAGPSADQGSYRLLCVGWALILAASFGLVGVFAPARAFLGRAVAALALSSVAGAVVVMAVDGGWDRARGAVYSQAATKADTADVEVRKQFTRLERNVATLRDRSLLDSMRQRTDNWTHSLADNSVLLLPALLALQSLAALALAWEGFHMLARSRAGPPLGQLREFRFSDQLVWAVAVGLTILLLPEFIEARPVAINVLVFFGALYTLRGLGVMAAVTRAWMVVAVAIVAMLVFYPFVGPRGVTIAAALPLFLGLTDTWIDYRRAARRAA